MWVRVIIIIISRKSLLDRADGSIRCIHFIYWREFPRFFQFSFPDGNFGDFSEFGEAPVPQAPKNEAPREGAEKFEFDFINKNVSNSQYDPIFIITCDCRSSYMIIGLFNTHKC